MLRSRSRVLLRKVLYDGSHWMHMHCQRSLADSMAQHLSYEPRFMSERSIYLKQFRPLSQPLPGLKLPPALPECVERFPTKITVLPNGLKIASEDSLGPAASVGLFVDCGSIYETDEYVGSTHLLERLAFKSTKNRSHLRILREIMATGGNVNTSVSREQIGYCYDTLKAYLPEAVELLTDCVRNPVFLESEVKEQMATVKMELGEQTKDPQQFLLELLHLAGYSGPLGNPLMATDAAFDKLNGSIIRRFYYENFSADRMVLAGFGMDHEYLLALAEPLWCDLQRGLPLEVPRSTYIGGDLRRQAELGSTHVAVAFEVPGGWHHEKDATTLTVLQTLMGGGGSFSTGGPGKGMHSRLYLHVLSKHQQVQSITAVSSISNDTGFFGIHLTTGSDFVERAVDIACHELVAIATPGCVTEIELVRAKNATKSVILTNLESRVIATEDIGRQILIYGCRKPIEHFLECLEEITLDDLTAIARKILASPLTMASWGDVNRVPNYDSISKRFQVTS